MVASIFGAEFHGDDVGTGVGFGHGQGADVFTADELGQVLFFLLVGAVAVDLVNAQVGVRAVRESHGCRGTADFLHGDDVCEVAHARAAVGFVNGNTQQAHVTELFPQVVGEQVVMVDGFGAGGDFTGGKAVDLLAQHIQGLAEAEVEL